MQVLFRSFQYWNAKNGLVLSNTRVLVSGTWSILFPNLYRKGFVGVLHFEGGRIILLHIDGRGFVGKGSVAYFGKRLGKDALRQGKHDSFPVWLCISGERKLDSFPMWSRPWCVLREIRGKKALWKRICHMGKDSNVERDSYAVRGEEKAWILPHVGKHLQGRIAMHLGEETLTPSPSGKNICAFKEEEQGCLFVKKIWIIPQRYASSANFFPNFKVTGAF